MPKARHRLAGETCLCEDPRYLALAKSAVTKQKCDARLIPTPARRNPRMSMMWRCGAQRSHMRTIVRLLQREDHARFSPTSRELTYWLMRCWKAPWDMDP